MLTFKFTPPAEAGLFVRLRQSATADGARSIVGTDTDVDALPDDGAGKKILAEAAADPAQYSWLSFVRVVGAVEVEGDSRGIVPAPADPDLSTLTVTVRHISGAPAAGVKIAVTLQDHPTLAAASVLHPGKFEVTTDAGGVATFDVVRGGCYTLSSKAFPNQLVTADQPVIDLYQRIG